MRIDFVLMKKISKSIHKYSVTQSQYTYLCIFMHTSIDHFYQYKVNIQDL